MPVWRRRGRGGDQKQAVAYRMDRLRVVDRSDHARSIALRTKRRALAKYPDAAGAAACGEIRRTRADTGAGPPWLVAAGDRGMDLACGRPRCAGGAERATRVGRLGHALERGRVEGAWEREQLVCVSCAGTSPSRRRACRALVDGFLWRRTQLPWRFAQGGA